MFDSEEECENDSEDSKKKSNSAVLDFLEAVPEVLRLNAVSLASFKNLGLIARGSFCRVFHALAPDGLHVALKRVSLHYHSDQRHEMVVKTSLREIHILTKLHHRHVVELKQLALGTHNIYLVFKYYPLQLLTVSKLNLPAACVKLLCHQLLTGVEFIHQRGLIHRDIKPDNIMLDKGCLKIGDFGSAAFSEQVMWTPQTVTLWYRAPEILLGCAKQTYALDLWSVGCVMAELIMRKALFRGHNELSQINKIVELLGTPTKEDWPDLEELPVLQCMTLHQQTRSFEAILDSYISSPDTLKLLASMLIYDPNKRASASQCLNDEYFLKAPKMWSLAELDVYCSESQAKKRSMFLHELDETYASSTKEDVLPGFETDAKRVRKKLNLDISF